MTKTWALFAGLAVLSCGQGEAPVKSQGRPLARVGGEVIGEAQFKELVAELPAWTESREKGSARVRDYLQSLVDRALILQEARARGLERDPQFRQSVEQSFDQKLAQEVDRREVHSQVAVSAEEVQQAFAERHWARQLKVAHIFARTRSRAEAALAALRAGRAFEEVAEEFSEDPPSAARGGEMPYYYSRRNATPAVRDTLFRLQVGQVSGLVPIPRGYEIFKVLDERQVGYEKVEDQVRKELFQERLGARRQTFLESLARQFGLEPIPQGLGVLMGILRQGQQQGRFYLSPADAAQPLFRDHRGEVALGEAVAQSPTLHQGRGLDDSLKVVEVLQREVLAPRLLALRARELKIDAEPEFAAWLKKKEEEALILAARRLATAQEAAVSDQEVRHYYEEHREDYRTAVSTDVVEVQVATEAEARELLDQLEADRRQAAPLVTLLGRAKQQLAQGKAAGEELQAALQSLGDEPEAVGWLRQKVAQPRGRRQVLEELSRAASPQELAEEYLLRHLAVTRSLRPGGRPAEGRYRLYWYEEARFGPLVEQAMAAQVGALIGPVPADSLYSIAKVTGRQGSQIRPFEEVARLLKARLQQERENQVFARWLEGLRAAHRGEVEFFEENIEALGREFQDRSQEEGG